MKCQIYLSISEVQPNFNCLQLKLVQTEEMPNLNVQPAQRGNAL